MAAARLGARTAELIRAFVDVAVSAQRETTRDGILLKPITGKHIRSLRGKYKHLDLMKGLRESRKEDRQRDW